MRLVENWRSVLAHAWSVRLLVLATMLSIVEAILTLVADIGLPPIVQAAIPMLTMAACVARVVVQRKITKREGIEE